MRKLALLACLLASPAAAQSPLSANSLGQVQMPPQSVLGNALGVTGPLNSIPYTALPFASTQSSVAVSPLAFGAVCDGVTNDATAFQTAINALPVNGGVVQLPIGKTCAIAATLTIGNGTSNSNSTVNGIVLQGGGSGNAATESVPVGGPSVLKWTGSLGGTVITVAGPVWGVKLSGIVVDCNSSCNTGINLVHPMASRFEELMVMNWRGSAYVWTAYPSGTSLVTGSQHNTFTQLRSENPVTGTGASGITIGGTTSGALDTAQSVFIGGQFVFDGTNAAAAGIILQFADNISFQGTNTQPQGGALGVGLKVVPTAGATNFPQEIVFVQPSLQGGANNPGAGWTTSHGISFFGYGTQDGEPIPVANAPNQYTGITNGGLFFNGVTQTGFDTNGNIQIHGTTPTLTAGCNGAGSSVQGNNMGGLVQGQSAAATSCTLTFANGGFPGQPICVVSGVSAPLTGSSPYGATTLQVNFASTGGFFWSYICHGFF